MRIKKTLGIKLICTQAYPHAQGPWSAMQEKREQALERRTAWDRASVGRKRPKRDERSMSAWHRLSDKRDACLAVSNSLRPSRSRGMHPWEWPRSFCQIDCRHNRRRGRPGRPPVSVALHRLEAWGYDECPF